MRTLVELARTVDRIDCAPQPRHRTAEAYRFPWSDGFDRIFRNEGAHGFRSRQLH
jgi:hypothetical protein